MQYSLKKMLGLQAFKIKKIRERGNLLLLFYVKPRRKTADCPKCNIRSGKLHSYLRKQKIKHIRVGNKLSYLILTKRRFYCSHCKKVFTERIKGIKYRNKISQKAKKQALSHLADRSFSSASRQTNIGYASQRRYLKEKIKPFLWDWSDELEHNRSLSLGLDEISFSGHDMVRVITNITDRKLKTILPDDLQKSLIKAINSIPEKIKKRVKEVVIDLNNSSRWAVKRSLPHAKVVADRFHIIQDANHRINQERIVLQEQAGIKIPKKIFEKNKENLTEVEEVKLKKYFKSFPHLRIYWENKEKLRAMYLKQEKKKAAHILDSLIKYMQRSNDRDLKQWARTLTYWRGPILNFFDNRTTNGFTEGVNTKLKLIKRISYGFRNKGVFIRKAMLAFLPFVVFSPHLTV